MNYPGRFKSEVGFSMIELTVSMCILIPIMGAAVGLFSLGSRQHATEQSGIEANQEARSAFEMITTEISQAGSHGDRTTTLSASILNSTNAQPATVASAAGFNVGDFVEFDTAANHEIVQLTAVGTNTISGVFRVAHAAGTPVRLFAIPYLTGLIPNPGMPANSSATVPRLRFYGDISGDATVQYVEYAYNAETNEITRSITPVNQTTRNQPIVLVRNVIPGSVQFSISTDNLGVVTAATVSLTVRNDVKTASKYQETEFASRISIPSAMAASTLLEENRRFGGFNRLPPTPPNVAQWISQ